MKIFYISYWGVKEGLTTSTVLPNLKMLSDDDRVERIYFFSMERSADSIFKDDFTPIPKVEHLPIFSKNLGFFLFTKIADWLRIWTTINNKAKEIIPDLVICRGAMAGAFGTMLYKRFKIPFVVESFEPHAEYMLESGVWKKNSLRYRFQKKTEKEIKQYAEFLLTVSYKYADVLNEIEKIDKTRLKTVPCMVPVERFAFSAPKAKEIRTLLNAPQKAKVAVYLGKFGGIYYDDAAFRLFKHIEQYFQGNFFLILLTPSPKDELLKALSGAEFPLNKCWIGTVSHQEVPDYLSAADFAINLHKSTENSLAYSPIKNGEYWANGLPILIPDNIGDDSDIVRKNAAGAVFNIDDKDSIISALKNLEQLINSDRFRIEKLAKEYRSFELGKKAYDEILVKLSENKKQNN